MSVCGESFTLPKNEPVRQCLKLEDKIMDFRAMDLRKHICPYGITYDSVYCILSPAYFVVLQQDASGISLR